MTRKDQLLEKGFRQNNGAPCISLLSAWNTRTPRCRVHSLTGSLTHPPSPHPTTTYSSSLGMPREDKGAASVSWQGLSVSETDSKVKEREMPAWWHRERQDWGPLVFSTQCLILPLHTRLGACSLVWGKREKPYILST